MLNTALVVALGGGLASQPNIYYPDQIDVLRGADATPQIELVLDTSGSMGDESWNPPWASYSWGCFPSTCTYYWSTRPPPTNTPSGNGYESGVPSERDCFAADTLSKNDQLKAALTGCQTATDGILDKWDQRVVFAVRHFGDTGQALLEDFDPTFGNHAALENAVLNLLDQGGTPLAEGYAAAAQHINAFWNDTNTEMCRQNFIVLMTDGEGNTACRDPSYCNATPTLNWVAGLPAINIADASACFPAGCADYTPPFADVAASYLNDGNNPALGPGITVDALNSVTGNQQVKTYTIGFQAPINGGFLLQAMATEGDGRYYSATDYTQLDQAFTDIITDIVARSNVTFTAGNVQADGIFSGNYIYSSAFKPIQQGHWSGTVRKYCIIPTNPADDTCLFHYPSGNINNGLNTNPQAEDVWARQIGASVRVQDAEQGGTGRRIWNDLFDGADVQTDPVPTPNPLRRRTILTWRHGEVGYIPVNDVYANDLTGINTFDTWTNNLCEHYSLINKLHGYTQDVADCAAGNYAPAALSTWPQGDTVNGGTVVLKYSRTCESAGDRCYVATVANDGMLHLFNAYSGVETAAIIPPDLWTPNRISNNALAEINEQPNLLQSRKFYFDGHLRIFHDDNGGNPRQPFLAGNGVIDPGEPAHLIAPLGRGGAAYISFPIPNTGVGISANGIPDNTRNPPRPLYPDRQTGFEYLEDTWAAPWIGRIRYQGTDTAIAVFANGHRRQDDPPLAQIGEISQGSARAGELLNDRSNPIGHQCSQAPPNNWQGVTNALCDPMGAAGIAESTCIGTSGGAVCTPWPSATMCCYDWPGWGAINPVTGQTFAPPPWNFSTTGGAGHSIIYGPIGWQSGNSDQVGVSYRVSFDRFVLQPGDYIAILDSQQREAGRIVGNGTDLAAAAGGIVYTPWVNDTTFYLQFRSNGVDDSNSYMSPFRVFELQHVRRNFQVPNGQRSYPTIYVVDANTWNGPNLDGSNGQGFSSVPNGGDNRQAEALLARITSTCRGSNGSRETCVDRAYSADTTDLQYMVCGISSELSVYTEGDLLRSIYFMDRCGQIFKVDYNLRNPASPWSAERILSVNQTGPGGAPIIANSKDYRQGFAQLDLVLSSCNGRRSVGVYFGTGNLQRPAEFDNMMNASLSVFTNTERVYTGLPPAPASNQYADVMGVVWDGPGRQNATLANLVNVTSQFDIPITAGTSGFYIELDQNEKVLRKPLVLESIAYFKTYLPIEPATECVSARGEERFYVFNSCNARPIADGYDIGNSVNDASDRLVQATDSDIGGDILAVFPKGRDPVISHGNLSQDTAAELPKNPISRSLKMFMWRKFEE